MDDLISFYKTWDEYFNEISNTWEKILLSEVDKVYERKATLNYEHKNYRDILKEMWFKIKHT